MIIMIFGSIYHTIIGNLIMINNNSNDKSYSIESIQYGISPLIIGLAIGLILIIIDRYYVSKY